VIEPTQKSPHRIADFAFGDEHSREALEAGAAKIRATIAGFVNDVFGGPEQMQESLLRMVKNAAILVAALPQVEQRVAAAEKSVFERLLDYAWFFDPAMDADIFFRLAQLVDAQDEDAINRIMANNFRARLDAIAPELAANDPPRARLLTDAFAAHREQRYALAIPVFLAQADGISRDLMGAEYFTFLKSKGLPEALIVQVAGDFFLESALRALIPKGTIREHTSKMAAGSFNRHAILHGIDTAYDSELNSLKAISLLNFMSTMNTLKKQCLAAGSGA
jgi:hypothetical protein